jgi:hypothetical protein
MAARCLVNRGSGSACLIVRNSDAGCYAATLEEHRLKILSLKQVAPSGQNASPRLWQPQKVLKEFSLPRASTNVRLLLGFSVEGSTLTAFIDGQPVMQTTDATFTEGTVGVGAMNNAKVYVSEVELFIPNKASFVVDRRASFKPAKNGAANDFKLPSAKSTPSAGN